MDAKEIIAVFRQFSRLVAVLVPMMSAEERVAVYQALGILHRIIDNEVERRKKLS